jgi:hypothetical protein
VGTLYLYLSPLQALFNGGPASSVVPDSAEPLITGNAALPVFASHVAALSLR